MATEIRFKAEVSHRSSIGADGKVETCTLCGAKPIIGMESPKGFLLNLCGECAGILYAFLSTKIKIASLSIVPASPDSSTKH